MTYLIDSMNQPNDFQRKRAVRHLTPGCSLFVVRRITRDGDEAISSEWYLIGAENDADAINCAKAETARWYFGDWAHEYKIENE
jgi:hypothetical protein